MALEDKVGTDVEWHGTVWQEWRVGERSGMDWTGTENLGRHGVGAAVGTGLD